jgi:hypothetical protein
MNSTGEMRQMRKQDSLLNMNPSAFLSTPLATFPKGQHKTGLVSVILVLCSLVQLIDRHIDLPADGFAIPVGD